MNSDSQPTGGAQQPDSAPSPVWVARYQRTAAGEGYATIECPECLGTFPHALIGTIQPVNETNCLHCGSPVRYAVFHAVDLAFMLPFRHERFTPAPRFAQSSD
jgi:hypothetical protein